MERKGRDDLKDSFSRGSLPTAAHFRQLIDSMLNLVDDDFQKLLLQMGGPLQLHVNNKEMDEKEVLIEFFKRIEDTQGKSAWQFVLSKSKDNRQDVLELLNEERDVVIKISQNGEISINASRLHLGGRVFQAESIGSLKSANNEHAVPANGKWHPILENQQGCQMFEVIACAGNQSSRENNYSMIKSTVSLIPVNNGIFSFLFPDKSTIESVRSYSGSRRNKMDLKWVRDGKRAQLMIRTRCDFKGNLMIHYRIKRVWANELMYST